MQYSILIYGVEGEFERLTEEEQSELMAGHGRLQERLKAKGQFAGAKLMPTSSAVSLKPAAQPESKPLVVDGPFAETKERLLGLYIADCETLEEAISFSEEISSPIVTIEIRPIDWPGGLLNPDA